MGIHMGPQASIPPTPSPRAYLFPLPQLAILTLEVERERGLRDRAEAVARAATSEQGRLRAEAVSLQSRVCPPPRARQGCAARGLRVMRVVVHVCV